MAARVLVVEDDEATRGALRALLDDAGYVCDEASDGERAVAAMRDALFDLVVLDPPYEAHAIVAPLRALVPHLAPGASVVIKHFWRTEPPEVEGLAVVRQRRFGETMLTFMELETA